MRRLQVLDGAAEVFQICFLGGASQLDIFMHRHALDAHEFQPGVFNPLAHSGNGVLRSNLADRDFKQRAHHTLHTRHLPDVLERDRVLFPIPSKTKFHHHTSGCTNCRSINSHSDKFKFSFQSWLFPVKYFFSG